MRFRVKFLLSSPSFLQQPCQVLRTWKFLKHGLLPQGLRPRLTLPSAPGLPCRPRTSANHDQPRGSSSAKLSPATLSHPHALDGPLRRGPLRAPFLQRKTIQLKRGREKEERIFRRVLDSRTCFESSSRWFGKYQPLWALFPSVYNGEINQHEGALSTFGQSHRPFPGSARASNRMAQRSRVISLSRDLTARPQRAEGSASRAARWGAGRTAARPLPARRRPDAASCRARPAPGRRASSGHPPPPFRSRSWTRRGARARVAASRRRRARGAHLTRAGGAPGGAGRWD